MTATTIRVQMAQRKDTAAGWTAANPILLLGELGYETDTKKFKIGDGTTNWNSLTYLPIPDGSGNLTITGNLEIGSTGTLTFEGSTADGFETTLAVTDPTADRTITLPDVTGTVVTTGDTGSVTSTMLADGTIVNADINASAEIAVSKLANGTANQVLVTDGTDVSWSDNLTLAGDLTVNGTTTTINTQDLLVEDKNIIIGNVNTPTDVTADGGGITLKGSTDKTINWVDATDAWTLSENVNIASGKEYRIDGTKVLDATSLGSAVVSSSLTSVGTIATGTWQGSAIDAAYLDSTIVTTGDTGTVTSTMILDGTIVDADINASAAIAGTKISPDFGSQNVTTTGTATAAALIPSGSSVPANGLYLPSANNVAISTNGTGRLFVDANGNVGIGTAAPLGSAHIQSASTGLSAVNAAGNELIIENSTTAGMTILSGNASTGNIYFADADNAQPGAINYDHSDNSLAFRVNSSERLRITSDGKLGVGTSSPSANLQVNGSLNAGGIRIEDSNIANGAPALTIIGKRNDANGSLCFGGKVLLARNSVNAASSSNNILGSVSFGGNHTDGSIANILYAASVYGIAEGTFNSASDMPTAVVIATGATGRDNDTANQSTGTERMRITSDGKLGLGTTNPDELLHIEGDTAEFKGTNTNPISVTAGTEQVFKFGIEGQKNSIYGPAGSIIFRQDGSTWSSVDANNKPTRIEFCTQDNSTSDTSETPRLVINQVGNVGIGTTSPGSALEINAAASTSPFIAKINTSEVARIDSSGRLLVGTSSAILSSDSISGGFQHQRASGLANANYGRWQNNNGGYAIYFAKSRGTSVGSQVIVQNNDFLGFIAFEGSDGSALVRSASIAAQVDGTPGANDMPGRLVFSTTADGASTPTERLRITSAGVLQVADAGNIAVGTTTGTKIGTATTQKLGFYNATPVVQPAAVADATDAATVITQLNDLLAKLRTLGLIAT